VEQLSPRAMERILNALMAHRHRLRPRTLFNYRKALERLAALGDYVFRQTIDQKSPLNYKLAEDLCSM
jgi:hypothetical protein